VLVDLNESSSAALLDARYDVCISGSGPAGIPLALKLAQKGHRVLLLEAGGLQFSEASTKVYQGTNTGLDYFAPDVCRQRFFGGTSNHWGGWCRAMSAGDFTARSHVPYSGWPIGKADLDPYLEETEKILHVHEPSVADYLLQDGSDANLRKTAFRYSEPPARMGPKYREAIESSDNLVCVLNANVVDIELNENLDRVTSLQLSDYAQRRVMATAASYVLCHGGIENPRTLLNANRQMKQGIGNQRELVGRFFMEHPHFTVGYGLLNHQHPGVARFAQASRIKLRPAIYEPSEAFQDSAGILNFGLRFVPGQGMGLPAPEVSFRDRLRRFVCESDALLSMADGIDEDFAADCPFDMWFKTACEQSPDPDSRIELGEALDRFGNRRVAVNWRLNELDKHTLRQSALQAGRIMAVNDLGRVRLPEWLLEEDLSFPGTSEDEVGGFHHMGTTRMADSPQRGVVDSNHKVFGIDNLYLGGSSVFATSGHVNPTLTIVQLSLRLADHLDGRLSSS
jgi:choline dehydrogenase-like flavoprotein